jgi:hypothetical protein
MEDTAPTLLDRRWSRVAALAFAILLLAIIAGGAYWFEHSGSSSHEDPVGIAEGFVSRRIPPGYTPHFNSPEWTQVRQDGRNYIVSGWLQALGRQGDLITMNYTVELRKSPQGWSAEHVDMTPQ